jgi:hypothetical protein
LTTFLDHFVGFHVGNMVKRWVLGSALLGQPPFLAQKILILDEPPTSLIATSSAFWAGIDHNA